MASTDIESIRQLIMETAGGAPEGAGSAIGLRLKDAFNDELDIKAEYGGLGAFIRRHCSDQIVWIRKRGGDDIYACKGSEAASAEASPRSGDTPWQALTHPNSHSDLALDSGSGTFRVVAAGSQMPEGFVLVEHVSRDEHREIARRFLEELGSELRE